MNTAAHYVRIVVLAPILVVLGLTIIASIASAQVSTVSWVDKWTSPQTLFAIGTFIVCGLFAWWRIDAHTKDTNVHHTTDKLREQFVSKDFCTVTSDQTNRLLERLEQKLDRIEEHLMSK